MILYNWRDLVMETETVSQSDFEKQIEDKFEAMMIDREKEMPSYIWTFNYVVQIRQSSRMYRDFAFVKTPRNPDSIF